MRKVIFLYMFLMLYTQSSFKLMLNNQFSSTSKQSICLQKKNVTLEQLESKLDAGLERSISIVISWVKLYLQTEQKKTDFKPEGDVDTLASSVSIVYLL